MLWPEEIRSVSGVAPEEDVTIRDAELDLADTLMETLGELDWSELHDEYRAAVEQLVTAKMEGVDTGGVGAEPAAASRKGQVVDLMAVLESSVQAARQSRGEEEGAPAASDATVHELRGAKKSAAKPKSGAAKKTSGAQKKSASGGKTAAKKATAKTAAKSRAGAGAGAGAAKKTGSAKSAAKKAAGGGKTAAKKSAAKKTGAKKAARTRKSA